MSILIYKQIDYDLNRWIKIGWNFIIKIMFSRPTQT